MNLGLDELFCGRTMAVKVNDLCFQLREPTRNEVRGASSQHELFDKLVVNVSVNAVPVGIKVAAVRALFDGLAARVDSEHELWRREIRELREGNNNGTTTDQQ